MSKIINFEDFKKSNVLKKTKTSLKDKECNSNKYIQSWNNLSCEQKIKMQELLEN